MESKADGAGVSRREFMVGAAAVSIAALAADIGTRAFAEGTDTLKVGLVGCGGRGTGAFHQHVVESKQPGMVAWAVGDVFMDKARGFARSLKGWGDQNQVADRVFGGFDNYKQVVDSGIDILVTATPPGFRPQIVAYAIDKGKHVFMEKPVAVDSNGTRLMLETAEKAKAAKLAIVCGAQRRHQQGYLQTMAKIQEGVLGDLVGGQFMWRTDGPQGPWVRMGRRKGPDGLNLTWQLDNWYHFNWVCGDQIVEQHVHNLDIMMWCFNDVHPTEVYAIGYRAEGRAGRPDYSHIYSGISAEFTFPNGAKCMSWSGHGLRIDGGVGERIVGTKGTSDCSGRIDLYDKTKVTIPKVAVQNGDPYVQEHIDLIQSIRKGEPLNECKRIAESTFCAIAAREAAYSGKRIHWDTLLKKDFSLMPPAELLDLDKDPEIVNPPVPVPGIYGPGSMSTKPA
jgi:predicted dehydrogenase